ncbi:hypothetical protein QTP86_025571, partial [Hemibagrus guttatus]
MTSYAWNMQVYTGKPADGQPEKNQGQRVVLEVTEGLRGHIITCDNFSRPMSLARSCEGGSCPWRRNVLLMSTLHRDTAVSATEDKKPQIILDYNKNKGGVDNLDKVTSVYNRKRMTARWPLTVFFNMIDVSAYNSFVLWREMDPSWNQGKCHKRRLFLEELGRELVTPKQRQDLPRTPASASLVMEVQQGASTSAAAPPRPSPKRRRCQFCTNDTKASTKCHKCDAHVCKTHNIVTCHL